jgi:hypothetical protein
VRDTLKTLSESDYWIYGLDLDELDYTISLVVGFLSAADQATEIHLSDCDFGDLDEETIGEIVSDHRYYNWIEKPYLWAFALWRMQGILEAMILAGFLPTKPARPLIGLKAKLDAIEAAGYSLLSEEREELIAWGNLRNLFSHMPPEKFRPIHLDRADIEDYKSLIVQVCTRWKAESLSLKPRST